MNKWEGFERAMVYLRPGRWSQQPVHRKVCLSAIIPTSHRVGGIAVMREDYRRDRARLSYRSRCSMSRKFEDSYRVWISKISRDLSGRIGEILEL
jgi:hypothetical protein